MTKMEIFNNNNNISHNNNNNIINNMNYHNNHLCGSSVNNVYDEDRFLAKEEDFSHQKC